MSMGSIWLGVVWVLQTITSKVREEKFSDRISLFCVSKNAVLITFVYLLPLIGLLWTEDTKHGIWDLRMKLPILFLPFVLLTLNKLNQHIYRLLMGVFLVSLIFAVTFCLFIYWQIIPKQYQDVREISVFISHIRFSLLLIVGLIICFYFAWKEKMGKILCVLLSIYFISFLILISSITGLIAFIVVLLWFLLYKLWCIQKVIFRIIALALPVLGLVLLAIFMKSNYSAYSSAPIIDWTALPKKTILGSDYNHHPQMPLVEDGQYVFIYLAEDEMKEAWKESSLLNPDSLDSRGNVLSGTLIRYLSSKGLRKDWSGVMQLNSDDVKNIEAGIADSRDPQKNQLRKRMDNILFELSVYHSNGNPSGHSVIQRLEFWRAGLGILKQNLWFGVGTGDTKTAFKAEYEKMQSALSPKYRLRAHNQYLTMFLTYGIIGGFYFLIVMLFPFFDKKRSTLTMTFAILSGLAMLSEDTLESQAGVMFYVVFAVVLEMVSSPNSTQSIK